MTAGARTASGAQHERAEFIVLTTSESPRVSIMVPSAAGPRLLGACLRSLQHHAPSDVAFEVIVLVNVDVEATAAFLRERVTGAHVVESTVNLGLAGAGNRLRSLARGELLVVLHDDAEVEPGWLEALIETADAHPEAGAIGGTVLDMDGRLQNAGMILWRDGTTSPPWIGPPPPPAAFDRLRAVDYSGTASLLVRATTWDAVGGLDEALFPAYYVDVDLSLAIRALGQVTLYQPASRIRHHKSASTDVRYRTFVSARNRKYVLEKWSRALAAHEPRVDGSAEAIARAVRRAENAAVRLRDRGALQLPPAPLGATELDVSAHERRHRVMDTEVQHAYLAWLTAALDGADVEIQRLRHQLADLRARTAILDALERGRWWGIYLRMAPYLRRFGMSGKGGRP